MTSVLVCNKRSSSSSRSSNTPLSVMHSPTSSTSSASKPTTLKKVDTHPFYFWDVLVWSAHQHNNYILRGQPGGTQHADQRLPWHGASSHQGTHCGGALLAQPCVLGTRLPTCKLAQTPKSTGCSAPKLYTGRDAAAPAMQQVGWPSMQPLQQWPNRPLCHRRRWSDGIYVTVSAM